MTASHASVASWTTSAWTKNATVSACAAFPTHATTPIRNTLIVARRSTSRDVRTIARTVRSVSRIGRLEVLRLASEHARVQSAADEQVGVRAVFHDSALVEDDDPLRVSDARETVGDEDRGQARGQVEEPVEQFGLAAD